MDLDGSLTGTAGYTAIPSSTVYPPECIDAEAEFSVFRHFQDFQVQCCIVLV